MILKSLKKGKFSAANVVLLCSTEVKRSDVTDVSQLFSDTNMVEIHLGILV